MTVAVAIRTGSAVVFAADSKLTTQALGGIEEDGTPRWQEQTYDHFDKIVHDRSKRLMAMAAGSVNIGQIAATDFISTWELQSPTTNDHLNESIGRLVSAMGDRRRTYWSSTRVPPENWPGPTLLIASASADGITPRVWRVVMHGPDAQISDTLEEPGIRVEGSYDEVFTLLYGFDIECIAPDFLDR